jgi:hypothetical protein
VRPIAYTANRIALGLGRHIERGYHVQDRSYSSIVVH